MVCYISLNVVVASKVKLNAFEIIFEGVPTCVS